MTVGVTIRPNLGETGGEVRQPGQVPQPGLTGIDVDASMLISAGRRARVDDVTTLVRAPEAARRLGVSTATLYSYVSRGRVRRTVGADGRTSLFDVDELEALRGKHRRPQAPPPTIDVRIASSVTQLSESGVRYRNTPVAELVDRPYEQVCALLWSAMPPRLVPIGDPDTGTHAATVMDLAALLAGMTLPDDPVAAADLVLGAIPGVLGGSDDPERSFAERLALAWVDAPSKELVAAVNTALVLLADHELATSTLAVRVAASVRASPGSAFVAGLATVDGELHGSASHHAHQLFVECAADGAERVLSRHRAERRRVPGFGHSIYRETDPRFELLLDRVRRVPGADTRLDVVEGVLAIAGRYVAQAPNIDLALGALSYVSGLPDRCPLFAVARIAGWTAHYIEELEERPLRYRGLSY